jgi:hypothetical protein
VAGRPKITWTPEEIANKECNHGHVGEYRSRKNGSAVCNGCLRVAQAKFRERKGKGLHHKSIITSVVDLEAKRAKLIKELAKVSLELALRKQLVELSEV